MTAWTPSRRAARATPWAWLPDEWLTTPAARADGGSVAMALYAPRSLKAPIGCSVSGFSQARSPNGSRGVRTVMPSRRSAAAMMSASPTSGGGGPVSDGEVTPVY